MKSGNLGYPRIGLERQWKKVLESFWAGDLAEAELHERLKAIRLSNLRLQQEKGIEIIPVGDFTYYDHVLDTAVMFGLIPRRFGYEGGTPSLSVYYDMARGSKDAAACEMTKWFNTNYHYIVPELDGAQPVLTGNRLLEAYAEAKEELGIEGRPVLVGPLTFVKLAKGYAPGELVAWTRRLLPLYVQVLRELAEAGVQWVQVDEPVLSTNVTAEELALAEEIYGQLVREVPELRLFLQTYFEAVESYEKVVALPVHGIGLDFVHDRGLNLEAVLRHGFPAGKVLGAGLVDGRNIWACDPDERLRVLTALRKGVEDSRLVIQPSCSLLHVPVSTVPETGLDPVLREALAFADQKLEEIVLLTKAGKLGEAAVAAELDALRRGRAALAVSSFRNRGEVRERMAGLADQPVTRAGSFEERRDRQEKRWQLPLLPTTTIGSFPQTPEVRSARRKWRKGEWTEERYQTFIREEIGRWIGIQQELGLDVLVHGEFERNDMVEFFGEKLEGFAFTGNGWVQSYGSRCVKPPVIFGDVEYTAPMTVAETVYAQSLSEAPVKGMLTGPVTILNWSFVRDDLPRRDVAFQIALALRQEVEALEAAGIGMIQVDEPALREGLPLKQPLVEEYLEWTVKAFRLSTSTVKDDTQIHTHMCYCEFQDMIGTIRALDADVISIETSRSHGELIASFEEETYELGIGLGVYDIHSPRVPPVAEMEGMIRRALQVLSPRQFWINPDCGLKTRRMLETVAALGNMVQAARQVRAELESGDVSGGA